MKLKRKILLSVVFLAIIMLFSNKSYAGTQRLNSLDYDATLNEDGSMDVVEDWNIFVSQTNTLFKDFNLDSSKYSGITNVKVTDAGRGIDLTQIDTEMYHVTQDCYYGLEIEDNVFEIAWGVGLDNSSATKKYKISYTIEDAITVYNDCSQLYWQFIGDDNGVPADKVTGRIHLPTAVKNMDNLRVWAHGPLNGEIRKQDNQTVWFEVDDLSTNTMLEVRVAVEESMFPLALKKESRNILDEILEEETEWANKANKEREISKLFYYFVRGIYIVIVGIYIVIAGWFLTRILKYLKKIRDNVKENNYQEDAIKYFRDIPRENESTPAEASFLFYDGFGMETMRDIFSATLLNLCLKKYLTFDCTDKNEILINLLPKSENFKHDESLHESEKIVLRLLNKIRDDSNSINLKNMESYAKTHYNEFHSYMTDLHEAGKNANSSLGNYSNEKNVERSYCIGKAVGYGMLAFFYFTIFANISTNTKFLSIVFFELIACVILSVIMAITTNVLTKKGKIEREQWRGLKRYMEDFALLKDKEVPDLVLWEKYLVYATTFGISQKVINQLKIVYPEFNNLDSSKYSYMYLMNDSRFEHGFENTFNDSIERVYSSYQSAYNAAHSSSSSGSGGGGGFSSGGGGRRRRWPEWAEDKN